MNELHHNSWHLNLKYLHLYCQSIKWYDKKGRIKSILWKTGIIYIRHIIFSISMIMLPQYFLYCKIWWHVNALCRTSIAMIRFVNYSLIFTCYTWQHQDYLPLGTQACLGLWWQSRATWAHLTRSTTHWSLLQTNNWLKKRILLQGWV